jgi:hypothetical protein
MGEVNKAFAQVEKSTQKCSLSGVLTNGEEIAFEKRKKKILIVNTKSLIIYRK